MSRALRALVALSVMAAATSASAFVRSTTGDPSRPLFWRNPQLTYLVNATGFTSTPGCTDAAAAAALTRASFPAWDNATRSGESQACTSFRFLDGGSTSRTDLGYNPSSPAGNVNLVVFRHGQCSALAGGDARCGLPEEQLGPCIETYNCWSHDPNPGSGGTLALTTATFIVSTGEILDADMELNGWNESTTAPAGFYFTCAPPGTATCPDPPYQQANCIEFDVGNTVTHEAGHMLGLDHVCVTPGVSTCHPEATMAPTAAAGDTDKRTLSADDVEGVCSVYPSGNTNGGGGGCSTGGVGALSVLAAGVALFQRWRRRRG